MTTKDKLKDKQTMTTGVTTSGIKQGDLIVLHGSQIVKVIVTDAEETIAEYENGAQRLFSTGDLSSFRELGSFPHGSAFYRATEKGIESVFVEHITPDTYIVEAVDGDGHSSTKSMSYADLIAWHNGGNKLDPNIKLPTGGQLYTPKTASQPADVPPTSTSDEEVNPFESDLQKEVEDLRAKLAEANKAAEQAEINGQVRINALQRDVAELRNNLLTEHDQHTTELLAKNQQIDRLEAKAAILTPVGKEYAVKFDINQSDLNKLAIDGWTIEHAQFVQGDHTMNQLNVVLIRDLPAFPAPKVTVTDTAIYGTPAHRPPVTQPPQTVILNTPAPSTGRMLTNNGPKQGETKRIPTLADIEARREQDAAELDAIFQRGQAAQEAIRREYASKPSPFPVLGASS